MSEQAAAHQEAQIRQMRDRDISFQVLEDGRIAIASVPPLEQAVVKFYTDSHPCFFPGCAELRVEWHAFLDRAGWNDECTDCEKGQLMNQFRDRLVPVLQAYLGSNGNAPTGGDIRTGNQPLPGSGKAVRSAEDHV